ncbi:MAG: hypothetical protein IPI52_16570, partial [Bacteroidetes bacterium]|nr:hypothetical protein [Bacteroidota bacterium]
FVVVLVAAAGLHGWRYLQKERAIAAMPAMPGAPEGMLLLPGKPGAPKTLVPLRGTPERLQIDKFKAQQQLLGNQVTELGGGMLVITPAPPPSPPVGGGRTP